MTDFGDELHRLLAERRVSLREAARRAGCSAGYLSNVATGRKPLTPSLAASLDRAFETGGTLTAYALRLEREHPRPPGPDRTRRRSGAMRAASRPVPAATGLACDALRERWPGIRLSRVLSGYGADWIMDLPPGRLLDGGGQMALKIQPVMTAADGGAFLPVGDLPLAQLKTPRHGMLLGADERDGDTAPRLLALDLRRVRLEISRAGDIPSAVNVPQACELDDLGYAILWAVAGLDDALLADDNELDERHRQLRAYEQMPESSVGRKAAAGLTSAARMWLGSSFCAGHVLRNLSEPAASPVFWTREQTGEEACTWLLFRHKLDYLTRISALYGRTGQPLIRGFCIPEQVTQTLPRWERVLLWLAAALMESLGIRVKICADPGYAGTDGFVLVPGDRAVIATWIRAEGIWYAGQTTRAPDLRTFSEVAGYAAAHSVIEDATPAGRLRLLASYLSLDWNWLTRRCAGLGQVGCARLIQPHSRLLSTRGVDTALRFAGELAHPQAAGTR
jgi:transcriptional regulator with XRE-family HTH domain